MWLLTLIESLATGTACGDVYLLRYVFYLLRDVVLTAQRRRLSPGGAKFRQDSAGEPSPVGQIQWDLREEEEEDDLHAGLYDPLSSQKD